MKIKVKICGLSTPETIKAAVDGGTDYLGFVYYPPSPRHVSLEQLRELRSLTSSLPQRVQKVGVVVDATNQELLALVANAGLNALQLHGSESPTRVMEIKDLTKLEVWKAIAVKSKNDLEQAKKYQGLADFLLYDAKPPQNDSQKSLPGGMGICFDWDILRGFAHPLAWGLAGGITADNFQTAIEATNATMIDISSGVEKAPGVKSVEKIKILLKAIKNG